jgi:hypothetical protein
MTAVPFPPLTAEKWALAAWNQSFTSAPSVQHLALRRFARNIQLPDICGKNTR